MRLFEEVEVPKDKYLLRIPATWEGIQAARTLEAEGAATHIIMVYRCASCWWCLHLVIFKVLAWRNRSHVSTSKAECVGERRGTCYGISKSSADSTCVFPRAASCRQRRQHRQA